MSNNLFHSADTTLCQEGFLNLFYYLPNQWESSLSDLCFQSFPKHSALSADVWSMLSISLQVNVEKTWLWICKGYMEDMQPEVSVLWCQVLKMH